MTTPKFDPTKDYKIQCSCGVKHIIGPGQATECSCGVRFTMWRLEKEAAVLDFNEVTLDTNK